jgi:primosomal protein N'
MKLFIALIVGASIVGGFVGGLFTGATFSIIGAAIGGVGLAATVLSLGAFLTAQDERKKKQSVPPDVRAVFEGMLGGVPNRGSAVWRARPFHANKSDADFLEWFKSVSPWSELDEALVKILIDKFRGNPLFEVFVHTSREQGLVAKYAKLNQQARGRQAEAAICPRIAMILANAAEDNRARLARALGSGDNKAMNDSYPKAVDAVEVALVLAPRIALLHLQMATLKKLAGKKEEAAHYCRSGLQVVEEQKAVPFHLSLLSSVREGQQQNQRIAAELRSVLAKL